MKSVVLFFTLFFVCTVNAAFAAEPTNTTDANNEFVKFLEAKVAKVGEAAKNGDLEGWLALRDAKTVEKVRAIPGINGDMLKQSPSDEWDLSNWDFIKLEVSGDTVRTLYQKKRTDDDVTIQAGIFHKENGDWKVGKGLSHTQGGGSKEENLNKAMAAVLNERPLP